MYNVCITHCLLSSVSVEVPATCIYNVCSTSNSWFEACNSMNYQFYVCATCAGDCVCWVLVCIPLPRPSGGIWRSTRSCLSRRTAVPGPRPPRWAPVGVCLSGGTLYVALISMIWLSFVHSFPSLPSASLLSCLPPSSLPPFLPPPSLSHPSFSPPSSFPLSGAAREED